MWRCDQGQVLVADLQGQVEGLRGMTYTGAVVTNGIGSLYLAYRYVCSRVPGCYPSDFGGVPGVQNLKIVGLVAIGR